MTNLTSEQYRDVINNVPNATAEIPTVQQLLRRAVQTFYERFGAYPELGGVSPGKIGMFGDHTQFDKGMALTAASSLATVVVGRKVDGRRFTVVTSADVGKPHKVKFTFSKSRPPSLNLPAWLKMVKGVIDSFKEADVPAFEIAIESSIPLGVGLGSSSGLEVAIYSFLEVLVGKKSDPVNKVKACLKAEEYAGRKAGVVDRMTSVMAKDRNAMVIDCVTNEVMWLPIPRSDVAFVAVDTHVKDTLFGDEYPLRSKYLAKACEMLEVEDLRKCSLEDVEELENRVNEMLNNAGEEEPGEDNGYNIWSEEEYEKMIKRTRFFITEMDRIEEAVQAWNDGKVETFGEKMIESHRALKEDFDVNNPLVDFLVQTSLQVVGVLGSKMTGMGLAFGGTILSVMEKKYVKKYTRYVNKMFAKFQTQIENALKEAKIMEKTRQRVLKLQNSSAAGEASKDPSLNDSLPGDERPCVVSTWASCVEKSKEKCKNMLLHNANENGKEDFWRKRLLSEGGKRKKPSEETRTNPSGSRVHGSASDESEVSDVKLPSPTFYLVSPLAGARMLFVTRTDLLRSVFARPLPDPKALVRAGLEEYKSKYGTKLEAIGLAPATVTLFGDFMEFHRGYVICMALPMYTMTLGGRNDGVHFAVKTMSEEVQHPTEMRCPLPCIRSLRLESRNWVNFVMSSVNEFKEHVPGFNGVIHSSVPIDVGVNSCAALQSSLYTFLEGLTRESTDDPLEKADRCSKSEYEFLPEPSEMTTRCSSIKFLPTFVSKEGHLTFINFKRYKISHYFFDHPSYVFLLTYCKKNETQITIQELEERLRECKEAIDTLKRNSLLGAELNHLKCLGKQVASENVIKRAKYVISEHQRSMDAVAAVKDQDYERIGMLMNQSQASLRDDYGISCPQIDRLVDLALRCPGVLGAKMISRGLGPAIMILVKIADADACMRYMRRNYSKKKDDLYFYMTKPSRGAFAMDPEAISLVP